MTAYTALKSTPVVTAFLRYERRILLLQCSDMVGSYQGRWSPEKLSYEPFARVTDGLGHAFIQLAKTN